MRQIGGFSGLNRTENFKEGQLRDSAGLTSEQYPTLTQSKPFVPYGEQSGIVDMYEHNGKLLIPDICGKYRRRLSCKSLFTFLGKPVNHCRVLGRKRAVGNAVFLAEILGNGFIEILSAKLIVA